MKLDKKNIKSLDMQEELEREYYKEQEFWRNAEKSIYGLPAANDKDHSAEIRVKVRPVQMDMINSIREKYPPGMFRSHADLMRSVMAAGCKMHFEILRRRHGVHVEDLEYILECLNVISKHHRLEDLTEEMRKLSDGILKENSAPENKINRLAFVKDLQKKLTKLKEGRVSSGKVE